MTRTIRNLLWEQSNRDLNKIIRTIAMIKLCRRQKIVLPDKYFENEK